MSDNLKIRLRTYIGSPLLPVAHEAADRIEQLEAALRDIADGTEEELTRDISSAALEEKKDG